jgi:hypothetical protein
MNECAKWFLFVIFYIIVLALDLWGIVEVFSLYFDDPFIYNARGYITSTSNCNSNYDDSAGHTTSGTIDVSFQFVDEDDAPYINISAPVPGGCYNTDGGCCESWMGKFLYIEIAQSNASSYSLVDLSKSAKTHDSLWIVFGAAGATFAVFLIVVLGCLVVTRIDRRRGYLTVGSTGL